MIENTGCRRRRRHRRRIVVFAPGDGSEDHATTLRSVAGFSEVARRAISRVRCSMSTRAGRRRRRSSPNSASRSSMPTPTNSPRWTRSARRRDRSGSSNPNGNGSGPLPDYLWGYRDGVSDLTDRAGVAAATPTGPFADTNEFYLDCRRPACPRRRRPWPASARSRCSTQGSTHPPRPRGPGDHRVVLRVR